MTRDAVPTDDVNHSAAVKAMFSTIAPRYDLLNVVRGDKTLREVMLRGGGGSR